ncbi:MAG: response regulator [Oligoflexales bacterium]|nr:response regulator [Oligoflexales bacterium]
MSKYKILLIEDDDDQRELLVEIIPFKSSLNLEVIGAINGKNALEKSKESSFDTVVTDYFMPDLDGLAFIKEFKKNAANFKIPIIFMSAFFADLGTAGNRDLFENVYFLDKPFRVDDLIKKIDFNIKSQAVSV